MTGPTIPTWSWKNAFPAMLIGLCCTMPAAAQAPWKTGLPLAPLEPPRDLREFDRFVKRCQAEDIPYKLSLKQLAEDCVRTEERGGKLPAELRYLRGFTWFFGFVIDRQGGDVILLGMKDKDRPSLDIDCLVTAFKAAYSGQVPHCSLDSHPDPRYQKSVIGGIDWNTRWASIMIEADYDMKRICQGHEDPKISSLNSWLEQRRRAHERAIQATGKPAPFEENRWWFNRPKKNVPRTRTLGDDIVILSSNAVVVMTEKHVDGKYGTGTVSSEADNFAQAFTWNLSLLGKKYKSIGELLTLYRLLDLMCHLKEIGKVTSPPGVKYWLQDYKHPYAGPPATMPTLTKSYTVNGGRFAMEIKGGVRMPLDTDSEIKREVAPRSLKDSILGNR